jgi:hypothetical protein
MIKLRVFVSSVKKELLAERQAVKAIVTSDPFLDEHCVAILHEDEPSMMQPKPMGYLDTLEMCQFCIIILGAQYGKRHKGLSATHREYHHAEDKGIPILPCVKNLPDGHSRDGAVDDFIEEIKEDGYDYERFSTERKLQAIVRGCLIPQIKKKYHIVPSKRAAAAAENTLKFASNYVETRDVRKPDDLTAVRIGWNQIDQEIAGKLAMLSAGNGEVERSADEVREILLRRGLLWMDGG